MYLKVAAGVVAGILLAAGVVFACNELGYLSDAHFAPKTEQVRHNTFECSQSHTDGLVRELRQMRDDYALGDAAGKAVLADRFKQEADAYTCGELPSDVASFRDSIR